MTIFVIGWVAVIAMVGVAATSVGALLAAREEAYTAADAAALAAAVATYPPAGPGSPVALAAEYAARNGSRLISCRCQVDLSMRPRTVTVTTGREVDVPIFGPVMVRASARSEFDPGLWLGE
ncbi:MAG: Rv3654c family TadE-like protein [Acidimicrobiia bacterium]